MAEPTGTELPPGKRFALAVICAATLMTIVDETVVSVALPSIQRDLGFSTADLSWVVDAYLISFGGLLLLAGRLGDLVGRARVLLYGVTLFAAASAACGTAESPAALVAARFAQGIGGAMAAGVALGMVVALFEDPRARARAIGIYSFVGASGASIGVFGGGVITDVAGWRWAFFINVPIGILAALSGRRVLPTEHGEGLRRGADVIGAVLLVAGVMSAILAIVDTGARLAAVVAAASLAGFIARQATARRPLLPLAVFRSRTVAGANGVHVLQVGAMFGFQFLVSLYLQRVLGFSPARAGLAVLPVAAGIGAMSLFVFPRAERRFGARVVLVPGLIAVGAGLALLTRAPVDGAYAVDVLPSIGLLAFGCGLTLPGVVSVAMADATAENAGVASGLINTAQQVGGALGLAALAALAASRSAHLRADGNGVASSLVGGFHLAWTAGALLLLAALVVAVVTLVRAPRSCPQRPISAGASAGA
jgi:EmrB/QacA subfamily drug resistance transporter